MTFKSYRYQLHSQHIMHFTNRIINYYQSLMVLLHPKLFGVDHLDVQGRLVRTVCTYLLNAGNTS